MELTTIHLVRHGEVHNPEGILYGQKPGFHLSTLGQDMAQGLGEAFAGGHDVKYVVASPLERAQETAQPTADQFGLPVHTDPRLIEADNHFEGVPVNKNRLILAHPRYYPYYVNPLRPSWGEPYNAIVRRMSGAIVTALDHARGAEAVLVSHQLPIWTMRRFVERKSLAHDPRRRECSLASVTSLTFVGDKLMSMDYWEPVGDLLERASDMVPGTSKATELKGGE